MPPRRLTTHLNTKTIYTYAYLYNMQNLAVCHLSRWTAAAEYRNIVIHKTYTIYFLYILLLRLEYYYRGRILFIFFSFVRVFFLARSFFIRRNDLFVRNRVVYNVRDTA